MAAAGIARLVRNISHQAHMLCGESAPQRGTEIPSSIIGIENLAPAGCLEGGRREFILVPVHAATSRHDATEREEARELNGAAVELS